MAAVLLISDDLDEVLALGDRVAVMHDGQLSEACRAEDWTREAIGLAMAGATPTVRAEPVEALRCRVKALRQAQGERIGRQR